jgi:hypothetical protein
VVVIETVDAEEDAMPTFITEREMPREIKASLDPTSGGA